MTLLLVLLLISPVAFAESAKIDDQGEMINYKNETFYKAPDDIVKKLGISDELAEKTTIFYIIDDEANIAKIIAVSSKDATSATQAIYKEYLYRPPDLFIKSAKEPETIKIEKYKNEEEQPGQVTSCTGSELSGMGWIICPITNFLAKALDYIYKIIEGFFIVPKINTESGSIYKLWSFIRDIANICFVIVFLIIIFSQVSSVGIKNYGIKTILPRLVLGAILVNISFWICSIAIDASNTIGASIHSIFTGLSNELGSGSNFKNKMPSWETLAAFVLSGGTGLVIAGSVLAGMTVKGALLALLPVVVACLLGAIVALIILAARHALIICLTIISPLAFVAYLLPNTEKFYEKWKDIGMTMLILFPIFAVLFNGAQLAGMAIVQNADKNILTIILGMSIQVVPLVITPFLIKFSGGMIGKLAGIVNNPNKGLIDRTKNWTKEQQDYLKNKKIAKSMKVDRNQNNGISVKKISPTRAYHQRKHNRARRIENAQKEAELALNSSYKAREHDLRAREIKDMQSQLDSDLAYAYATSEHGRNNDMVNYIKSVREAERKAEASRHIAEMSAGNKTDGYYGDFSQSPSDSTIDANQRMALTQAYSNIDYLNEQLIKTSLDEQAKKNAEFKQKESIAKSIDDNRTISNLRGMTTREYVSGVLGAQGQAVALANARVALRDQQSKLSDDYYQLYDGVNITNAELLNFINSNENTLTLKNDDGTPLIEIDRSDSAALNAMIKRVAKVGIVPDIKSLILKSGNGGQLFEYRETISEIIASRGLTSRSGYEGGRIIEEIKRGSIASDEDLYEYIQTQTEKEKKISPEGVAKWDPDAIKIQAKAIIHNRRAGNNDAGFEISDINREQYRNKTASLLAAADRAIVNKRIRDSMDGVTRDQLIKLKKVYDDLGLRRQADANGTHTISEEQFVAMQDKLRELFA